MMNGLLDRLRGARRIEFFAALALLALLALLVLGRGGGTGDGAEGTELEARVERILSGIDGVGRVSAMITQDADGRATAALIVADGLEDVQTWLTLQSAVSTLLELDTGQIEIIGKNGRFGGTV